MYTYNALIDQNHNLAKQFLYAVPHAELREELTKVVDAQVSFARAYCSAVEQVSKIVNDEVRKLATTNPYAK